MLVYDIAVNILIIICKKKVKGLLMKFVGKKKKSQQNGKCQYSSSKVFPVPFDRSQAEIIHIMKYQNKQFRLHFKDEKLFQSLSSRKGAQ